VKLPDSYSLKSPWQPCAASAGNGQMLYLQGNTYSLQVPPNHRDEFGDRPESFVSVN